MRELTYLLVPCPENRFYNFIREIVEELGKIHKIKKIKPLKCGMIYVTSQINCSKKNLKLMMSPKFSPRGALLHADNYRNIWKLSIQNCVSIIEFLGKSLDNELVNTNVYKTVLEMMKLLKHKKPFKVLNKDKEVGFISARGNIEFFVNYNRCDDAETIMDFIEAEIAKL